MDPQLLMAARRGKLNQIKNIEAVKGSGVLYKTTHHGNNALHIAAKFGYHDLVGYLIKHHHTLVLACNHRGETPVHLAARAGHVKIVKEFVERVKGFGNLYVARIRDKNGNTPVHGAVRSNETKVVEMLGEDRESLLLVNDEGESPLSISIDLKYFRISNFILSKNPATIDYRGPKGQTPLHFAVIGRDLTFMLSILRAKGELVRTLDDNGRSPLHYSAAFGHQEMVAELLKRDSSVAYQGDQNGQAPIHLATEQGNLSVVKALLAPCPDSVELLDKKQRNPLHISAKNGYHDLVLHFMKLPEIEDLVNSPDSDGNTPLHLAAMEFYSTVVYTLSRNEKVEIRAINKSNKSALETVESSDDRGLEMQRHLTLKALKREHKKRGVDNIEDVLEQGSSQKLEKSGESNTRKMANTLALMATLIATFTFTAAFTLPGGLKTDSPNEGTPLLLHKVAFQAFIVTDTIAMTSSLTASVVIYWSSSQRDIESLLDALPFALCLTWISLVALALAFVTGLFVVLSNQLWLAILVCVIGCASPVILYVFAPLLIVFLERRSSTQVSSTNRYNILDNNPFVFIFRLLKMKYR